MTATCKPAQQPIIGWYCQGTFPALFTDSVSVAKRWMEMGSKVSAVVRQGEPPATWACAAPYAAACDVLAERQRQISAEGWSAEHDDAYTDGQMAVAAGYYALASGFPHERDIGHGHLPVHWPWAATWWKPRTRRSNLVRAGALILAEIERLDRAACAAQQKEPTA